MNDLPDPNTLPEPIQVWIKLLGKLNDWPEAAAFPIEELLIPEALAQWNEESKEKARRKVENTGWSDQVEYINPRWARVMLVVDVPAEGYRTDEGEILAAIPVYVRFDEGVGWRVARIGSLDPDEELPN